MTLYPSSGGEIFWNYSQRSVNVVVGVLNDTGKGGDVEVSPGGETAITVKPGEIRYALFTVKSKSAIHVTQLTPETPSRLQVGVEVFERD